MSQSIDPSADDWARQASRRDRLADAVIAALLLACTAVTIPLSASASPPAPLWFSVSWALLITVPLAWRRSFPSTVAVVVTTVFLIGQITVTPEPLVSQIAPFIALYTVGAWSGDRRRSFVVRASLVAAIVAWLIIATVSAPARLPQQIGNLSASAALGLAALSSALYLAAAMAFGETAWRSARRRAVLEMRTVELQAERQHTARQAVDLERMRIARELHDVVAHHVSVISIQAGAARRVMATAPEKVADALVAIEQNARQAVDELHSTLVTLRSSDNTGVSRGGSFHIGCRADSEVDRRGAARRQSDFPHGDGHPGFTTTHRGTDALPGNPRSAHECTQACLAGSRRRCAAPIRARGGSTRDRRFGRHCWEEELLFRRDGTARDAGAGHCGGRHLRIAAGRARLCGPGDRAVGIVMERIRVLLADDQALVRAGFRMILESEPGIEVVGEAVDGREAVAATSALAPDVICMDIQMPGMDGLTAIREIVASGAAARVLVLTTFNQDDYLFEALEAGASGFLLKTTSPEDLVRAVQVVARGEALLAPEVTRRVIERFTVTTPKPREDVHLSDLTKREGDVLALVAQGRSNPEIAAALHLGEATVKTHVSHILLKLGVRDRTHLVIWSYENHVVIPQD